MPNILLIKSVVINKIKSYKILIFLILIVYISCAFIYTIKFNNQNNLLCYVNFPKDTSFDEIVYVKEMINNCKTSNNLERKAIYVKGTKSLKLLYMNVTSNQGFNSVIEDSKHLSEEIRNYIIMQNNNNKRIKNIEIITNNIIEIKNICKIHNINPKNIEVLLESLLIRIDYMNSSTVVSDVTISEIYPDDINNKSLIKSYIFGFLLSIAAITLCIILNDFRFKVIK